jgi:hypothetical protein
MWRFPASNHGERRGISSGDSETFRKAPYEAFAREILQNSIDVRSSDEDPTIVEFSVFDLPVSKIPGVIDFKNGIRRCKEFWDHKSDYIKEFESREEVLNHPTIKCLRVSDFNTQGLIGVNTLEQKNNNFLALTKGTGVSEKKDAIAGGSKGVGKNAAFLMSSIKTVFYSTRACKDINNNPGCFSGSIGVADFESGYIDDNKNIEHRDYTQGKGYYCKDILNNALSNVIDLDPSFTRGNNQFGTDIYVLGFSENPNWENEIIHSILNSFMASFVKGHLEVIFKGTKIHKDNVKDFVYNDTIIDKGNRSNVISQYLLLTSPKVSIFDIETEYGVCQLHVLPFSKEEEDLATHKCAMIRYPYMKIKDYNLGANYRASAMCIIENNLLGQKLRDIENPQHIDWEPKRIKETSTRVEMNRVLRDIKEQIVIKVRECLGQGDTNPLDPNGAGDFLPDDGYGEGELEKTGKLLNSDVVKISRKKENNIIERNANIDSEDGQGLEPDIGASDDSTDGPVEHPEGSNNGHNGEAHPGDVTSGEKEGDSIIFKRTKLSGVRYKVIALDKNGKLRIIFKAPIDYENCYLNIRLLDDANYGAAVEIIEMMCNEKKIISDDKIEFGPFEIKTNNRIILDVLTSKHGYYSSEVKIICK